MAEAGLNFETQVLPWKRALAMLEGGHADLIAPLFYTRERAARLQFSTQPIHQFNMTLFSHREANRPKITNIEGLKPFSLVKVRDTVTVPFVDQAVQEQRIRTLWVNNIDQQLGFVARKRVDLAIADVFSGQIAARELGIAEQLKIQLPPLESRDVYTAGHASLAPEVMQRINQAILQLEKSDGLAAIKALYLQ